MGDLRGALVDFADLEDTVVVVDIPPLYQLLPQRQALCAIYFTRAGVRPGGASAGEQRRPGPAGVGRVTLWEGFWEFTINFSPRVKC